MLLESLILPIPTTPNSMSLTIETKLSETSFLQSNTLYTNNPPETHPEPSPIPPREIITRSKTGKLKAK